MFPSLYSLGAFGCVMSVCPHVQAWLTLSYFCEKTDIGDIHEYVSRKSKFGWNGSHTSGTKLEHLITLYCRRHRIAMKILLTVTGSWSMQKGRFVAFQLLMETYVEENTKRTYCCCRIITGSLFSGGGSSKSLFALSNAPQCQCYTHTACLVTSLSLPNPVYGNPSP